MSVSCWSPAAPPCWEPLRIDGAIKTPSKETHTVTEGSWNIDNYSVYGLWSSRGRERGRTWGRRKQGERDWWWCISMHGGTAICSLRLHKNTNMRRRTGARRGESKTDERNERQKMNGCGFYLSCCRSICLFQEMNRLRPQHTNTNTSTSLVSLEAGRASLSASICQPVISAAKLCFYFERGAQGHSVRVISMQTELPDVNKNWPETEKKPQITAHNMIMPYCCVIIITESRISVQLRAKKQRKS